jgi:cell division protein FtsX
VSIYNVQRQPLSHFATKPKSKLTMNVDATETQDEEASEQVKSPIRVSSVRRVTKDDEVTKAKLALAVSRASVEIELTEEEVNSLTDSLEDVFGD